MGGFCPVSNTAYCILSDILHLHNSMITCVLMLSVAFEKFNLWQSVKQSVINYAPIVIFKNKIKATSGFGDRSVNKNASCPHNGLSYILSKHMKSVH